MRSGASIGKRSGLWRRSSASTSGSATPTCGRTSRPSAGSARSSTGSAISAPQGRTRPARPSALADDVAVQLLLGLPQGREGRPLLHPFLPVAAGGTAHHVYEVDVVVAAVGIGRIIGQRDPLEAFHPVKVPGRSLAAPPADHVSFHPGPPDRPEKEGTRDGSGSLRPYLPRCVSDPATR